MNKFHRISCCTFLLSLFILAGCATDKLDPSMEDGQSDTVSGISDESGVSSEELGAEGSEMTDEQALAAETKAMLLKQRVVYFDYDESFVSKEAQLVIEAHAELLSEYPNVTINLAGHADERGTREYNLALGDQRGEAVSVYFQENGIDSGRIVVTSFGEEQPAAVGSDEQSWSLNRRVEFEYEVE